MANDSLNPSELENELALDNGGMSKKVMVAGEEGSEIPTVTNFRILSVRKHNDSRKRYNTVAVVEVDRFPELPKSVKSVNRYRRRKVPFTRILLSEAFAKAGFTATETKAYQVTTVDSLTAITDSIVAKLNIDPNEVTFLKVSNKVATLTAKPDSLGFIGRVTLTTDSGSGEVPNQPKMVYAKNQDELLNAVKAGTFVLPAGFGPDPVNMGTRADFPITSVTDTLFKASWTNANASIWVPFFQVISGISSVGEIASDATVTINDPNGGDDMTITWGQFTPQAVTFGGKVYFVSSYGLGISVHSPMEVTLAGKMTNGSDIISVKSSMTMEVTNATVPSGPAQWVKESVTKQAFILGDDGDGLNDAAGLKPNGQTNFIGVRLSGPEAIANSKLRMKIDLVGNTHQELFLEPFYQRPGGLISFGVYVVDAGVEPTAKAIISVQGDPQFPFVEIGQLSILPE